MQIATTRPDLEQTTHALLNEFGPSMSTVAVLREVWLCRDELLQLGLHDGGLLDALGPMARRRLLDAPPAPGQHRRLEPTRHLTL